MHQSWGISNYVEGFGANGIHCPECLSSSCICVYLSRLFPQTVRGAHLKGGPIIARKPEYSAPLTGRQIARLKPLPGKRVKPAKTTISLGTFRLPRGAKTRVVKAPGRTNAVQLQVYR